MLRKILQWLRPKPQEDPWSVILEDGSVATSDGQGTTQLTSQSDITRVVVATDDSGPWGYDVVFLLYVGEQLAALFPLEAKGRDLFLEWLRSLPGYNDRELARSMGSTSIAQFTIYARP